MYYDVLLIENISNQDLVYTYKVAESDMTKKIIGSRVLVPVGTKTSVGLVIRETTNLGVLTKIKRISSFLDDFPLINEEMIILAQWVADYYCCSLNKVVNVLLPPVINYKKRTVLTLYETNEDILQQYILDPLAIEVIKLLQKKSYIWEEFKKLYSSVEVEKLINKLIAENIIKVEEQIIQQQKKIKEKVVELNFEKEFKEKYAPKQKEIIDFLAIKNGIPLSDLLKEVKTTYSTVKLLAQKEYIKISEKPLNRDPFKELFVDTVPNSLTSEQEFAINQIKKSIDKGFYKSFLLHGVTGSGKTEVYIRLTEYTLQKGKNVLVLVPEIALTPQLASRFKQRFGDKVALLHSKLSSGERYDEWYRIFSNRVNIVIGVRSAVFAPIQNIGLIIVDEEHEASYKQTEPEPRYHAKKVALQRGSVTESVVVLGSATPSLESYYEVQKKNINLIEMFNRVNKRPLPSIEIVDMRKELIEGNMSIFSFNLQSEIQKVLAKGQQAILFLNRRGFATFVMCRECGLVINCEHCAIPMTFHQTGPRLVCHYCGERNSVPKICPQCGSRYIKYFGSGTQKVENQLKELFPGIKVLRMDVDTVGAKGSHWDILQKFQREQADVLVGTQMIAKGLDFPKVSLVGVISADTTLNLPDYLSAERSFQLLTQVSGRAGRKNIEGKVIIQTYQPEHFVFKTVNNGNYYDFYEEEIFIRKTLGYPPFTSLVRIIISGIIEDEVKKVAEGIYNDVLKHKESQFSILGPSTAPIEKISGRFRWHIILKNNDPVMLKIIIKSIKDHLMKKGNKNIRVTYDIDPQSIL